MNDPIADMLTRIKNAGNVGKDTVVFSYSKIRWAILELLKKEGFIENFEKHGKKTLKNIVVNLKYVEGNHVINDLDRVSKLSRRVYSGSKDLRPFKHGKGAYVLTTPKGIMTDKMARKENVGGEVLFRIW